MKLHLAQNAGMLTFSSHGPGYVSVNGTRYEESVMVCGRTVEKNWAPDGFEGLTERQFEHLASLGMPSATQVDLLALLRSVS